jgi:hypothetical protein
VGKDQGGVSGFRIKRRWVRFQLFGFVSFFFYGMVCFLAFTSWRWAKAACLYVVHVRVEASEFLFDVHWWEGWRYFKFLALGEST